jgi:DNA-binding LacI/PurR family transcriptional regulator
MHERLGGFDPAWLQPAENSLEGGYIGMRALLALPERPTAVFASDDMMAIGAYRAIQEAGMRIPADISVLGFDDIKYSAFLYPALTTLCQPVDQIVASGMEVMLQSLGENSGAVYGKRVFHQPELVVRESCGVVDHSR